MSTMMMNFDNVVVCYLWNAFLLFGASCSRYHLLFLERCYTATFEIREVGYFSVVGEFWENI